MPPLVRTFSDVSLGQKKELKIYCITNMTAVSNQSIRTPWILPMLEWMEGLSSVQQYELILSTNSGAMIRSVAGFLLSLQLSKRTRVRQFWPDHFKKNCIDSVAWGLFIYLFVLLRVYYYEHVAIVCLV